MVLAACNPTKDKWLNRKWHTLTGHYNVYFNAQEKFNDAVRAFEKGSQNDFNKILPVFILPDEAASKGMGGAMDEVIKKTSVAIQSHFVGSYTDDSYLLMGKAQFYKGDYFAALETFQYINSKFKDGDLNREATAWIGLCYEGLKKTGEAEAVMGLLINEIDPIKLLGKKKVSDKVQNKAAKITRQQKVFIYATAAHILIKQEKYNLAATRLKVALESTKVKEDKIRYNYILGQLDLINDSIPNAKQHFTKVIRLLAPYDFEFNANLNLTKTYDPTNKREVKQVKRNLKRMLRDDKNEGLYDQVYYELARIEQKDNDLVNAIKHYKLSVANSSKNQSQKALSYLALGNIYLAEPNYKLGQAYYDSAAGVIPKENKNYELVQNKKTVLSELIENILVIEREDSLQQLSKLSKAALEKKVDGWILAQKLKKEQDAKNELERKEIEKQAELNKPIGGGGIAALPSLGGDQGQWYFYNATVINTGKQEFFSVRKWGRRENEDFWRIAAKEKPKTQDTEPTSNAGKDSTAQTQDNTKAANETTSKPDINAERAEWVKDIPYTSEEKKKSTDKIIEAYYNLGLIYSEKLKDDKEAITNYNSLLNRFPGNKYEAEVLYYLYKLYNNTKQTSKAEQVKEELIKKYPESNYALILQSKTAPNKVAEANKEITKAYEQLYEFYLKGEYDRAKQGKREADKKYSGNVMQAKFDFLYALCVAKTDSLGAFKFELEEIVKAYPKTEVAEKAQAILDRMAYREKNGNAVEKEPQAEEFTLAAEVPYYYVFALKAEKFDMNDLLQKIVTYNDEFHQFDALRANTLLSADGYQLVYVREFAKLNKALEYLNGLNLSNFYKTALPPNTSFIHFAVSTDYFKKMLKDRKIEAYNTYFSQQLPSLIKQQKQ
ncbi:MAG: hypothetical protein EAY81_06700 [Bacteroidetes bacterium]|nr:MAG: hypothetical protein EAY81_06700 [Bacteroidota bacterium]